MTIDVKRLKERLADLQMEGFIVPEIVFEAIDAQIDEEYKPMEEALAKENE